MKKIFFVINICILSIALAACSEKELSDGKRLSSKENNESSQIKSEPNQIADVEITTINQVSYAFQSILDSNKVSFSAIVKNETNETIKLDKIVITYTDKEGKVVGISSGLTYAAPYILKPGQISYIQSDDTIDVTPDQFGKAELLITPEIVRNNKVEMINIENDKMIVENGNDEEKLYGRVSIKGMVINNSKGIADITLIGAALYDENDTFLGTTFGSTESMLKPAQSVGFDTSSNDMPQDVLAKVKKYEVNASYYPETNE